jgi:hypothetical protein
MMQVAKALPVRRAQKFAGRARTKRDETGQHTNCHVTGGVVERS